MTIIGGEGDDRGAGAVRTAHVVDFHLSYEAGHEPGLAAHVVTLETDPDQVCNLQPLSAGKASAVKDATEPPHQAAAFRSEAASFAARTSATSRFRLSAGILPFDRRSMARATDTLADRLPVSRS